MGKKKSQTTFVYRGQNMSMDHERQNQEIVEMYAPKAVTAKSNITSIAPATADTLKLMINRRLPLFLFYFSSSRINLSTFRVFCVFRCYRAR